MTNLKNSVIQVKNVYKYRAKEEIRGSLLWNHSLEESYRTKFSLIRTLINYF